MIRRIISFLGSTAGVGSMLTLAVLLADRAGALDQLERYLYDERVARFQASMPRPTDRLMHLDLDDASLDNHHWPWDRADLAAVIDELALAKPAAVALDVLFPEAQADKRGHDEPDEALAAALARLQNALVPASFSMTQDPPGPLYLALRDLLERNPQRTDEAALAAELSASRAFPKVQVAQVDSLFLAARRDAMFRRIKAEIAVLGQDPDGIRRRVLPSLTQGIKSPLTRLFDAQYLRALAALELEKRARPLVPGVTPPLREFELTDVPILPLERSAAVTGFVDYPKSRDQRIRAVPLLIRSDGMVYPQLGLSLACATLGVSLRDLELASDHITIPMPGGSSRVIPTRTLASNEFAGSGGPIPMAIDLPFFGPADWERMYSAPGETTSAQHLSIGFIWDTCQVEEAIRQNNLQADDALRGLYELVDPEKLAENLAHPLSPDDWKGRLARVSTAIDEQKDYMSQFAATADAAPAGTQPVVEDAETHKTRVAVRSYAALQGFADQTRDLVAKLESQRRYLRDKLAGKAVIVGWTATGSIADFVSTPLHDRCPGAVIHGLVFNAIMTGELWEASPPWAVPLVTVAAGAVTTLAVLAFTPAAALLFSLLLATVYVIGNGVVLFDQHNLIVGMAGPLTAIAVVWSGGTLTRLIREQRQRALIRRRFRTYVDPQLVDYVETHPTQATFAGEKRELTVVFTDIVGFTTLTEALGEKTVTLLNELWSRVVPVVRQGGGYLNKFLGDGVMFFYGAPMPNANHARDAVNAVLEIREVMRRFTEEVTVPRGLPTLGMRVGVSTGDMIVGDAGAGEAGSDYTVLGDNVNLGARLEGANKAFGTGNLMTVRTAELAGDAYLFRPIGGIYVVGKEQPVEVVEAMCRRDQATTLDQLVARWTAEMVSCYRHDRMEECAHAANLLDAQAGPSKLSALYRELALARLRSPDGPFDPAIELTSK